MDTEIHSHTERTHKNNIGNHNMLSRRPMRLKENVQTKHYEIEKYLQKYH